MESNLAKQKTSTEKGEVRFAKQIDKYWYPKMRADEVQYIQRLAKYQVNTTDNYIDNITKWLYDERKDTPYFALYSTEDVGNPTILFACTGDDARLIQNLMQNILEEDLKYGTITDRRTSDIEKLLESARSTKNSDIVNIDSSLAGRRRSNDKNDTKSRRKSRIESLEAFGNCLRNCWERAERLQNELTKADSTESAFSMPKDERKSLSIDTKYLELAKDPQKNEARLREMVDKAAKDNGYNSPLLYHGTSAFGFTEFDLEKMDDKRSIFLTNNPNIASTYSGITGERKISEAYRKDINKLSIPDLTKELNDYANNIKGKTQEEFDYKFYNFDKFNNLLSEVNSGIDKLAKTVENNIKIYADKLATDFDEKDYKIHSQLVKLLESLKKYDYNNLSTPIYLLLHNTNVFEGSQDIATLEKNIRLMGQLRTKDLSEGVIAAESLGGYWIEILNKEEAQSELENLTQQGNYSLFAKLGKSLVIDGKGQLWNDIRGWQQFAYYKRDNVEIKKVGDEYRLYDKATNNEIHNGTMAVNSFTEGLEKTQLLTMMLDNANYSMRILTENYLNTRDISGWAKSSGYDSVVFKNIRDNGGRNSNVGASETADIYVIFNNKNIKSADLVTYDDKGDIIPLSERFKDNNADIRYSKSVDIYTEEQYNNFGWTVYNNILNNQDIKYLSQEILNINNGNNRNYVKTRFNDYIIPIDNKYNVLVYVDDNIESPHIRKVIEIGSNNQAILDMIRSDILDANRNKLPLADEYVKRVYGEENFVEYKNKDFRNFQQYAESRRKGNVSQDNSESIEEWRNGQRPLRQSISEAEQLDSAFSMPRKSLEIDLEEGYATSEFIDNAIRNKVFDSGLSKEQKQDILSSANSYRIITDKETLNTVQTQINNDYQQAVQQWQGLINSYAPLGKKDIALGQQLLKQAVIEFLIYLTKCDIL